MTCNNCKNEILDDAIYCPKCGAPVNGNNTKETTETESEVRTGFILGIISLACSLLGLGSFGILDIAAIVCGHYGKKHLKDIPDGTPNKSLALTLNRAGILCSAAFIIVIAIAVLGCLLLAPWVFGLIGNFFGGLAAGLAAL